MTMSAVTNGAACPPHHWKIETIGKTERWACQRCAETKVIEREVKARPEALPFVIGNALPYLERPK